MTGRLRHVGVLEIPPLPPSTILLVEVGSAAHGTGLPGGEDHDEMGVVVESAGRWLGHCRHRRDGGGRLDMEHGRLDVMARGEGGRVGRAAGR
jgi:hypothetical protein